MRVRVEGSALALGAAAERSKMRLFRTHRPGRAATMANQANSLSHTKWMCKYRIAPAPKYRRKVIYNQYRESLGEIFRNPCRYKGVEIIEGHLMPDHVHMLVSIPPKISASSFMGYLKGKSALMMLDKHANLKYKFGNRRFWSEGYYVSTVGLNEATIAKCIREQEAHDIAPGKLSVKEYEDPFKKRQGAAPFKGLPAIRRPLCAARERQGRSRPERSEGRRLEAPPGNPRPYRP